jgi:hypothetical protein
VRQPRFVLCCEFVRFSRCTRLIVFVAGLILTMGHFSPSVSAQANQTPFEQAAAQAFNPDNKRFSSITMTGGAVWTAGSLTESGTVTFTMSSDGSFTETWSLPSQSHTFQSTMLSGSRSCTYTDPTGKQTGIEDASCLQAVPWFAPWFGLNSVADALATATDTTQPSDTTNGNERLSFTPNLAAALGSGAAVQQSLAPPPQETAVVNVSYNLKSALPAALNFSHLLDSNPAHFIQNDTAFTDYRPEGGYMLAHHIQRYIQRTLQADITITTVTVQ